MFSLFVKVMQELKKIDTNHALTNTVDCMQFLLFTVILGKVSQIY
jgi:hypothetical protein